MLHCILDDNTICLELPIHDAELPNRHAMGEIYYLWLERVLQVHSLDVRSQESKFLLI